MQAPDKVQTVSTSAVRAESKSWLITIAVVVICAIATVGLWISLQSKNGEASQEAAKPTDDAQTEILTFDPQTEMASGIEVIPVINSARAAEIDIPGVAEPNQEQLQQVTPLVSGRVDSIAVALGDYVKKGALLISIDSPQVAELHGKLHEAETRLKLAEQNMNRVTQAANRVSVLKSKATLEETEATLTRTKQLVTEGLSARKDLVAAEAQYERAKADFNFQKDISLNREMQEARAELSTAKTESEHIKDALHALDAHLPDEGVPGSKHDISAIELRAPMSGTVIERFVNPGAGFEAGKPLLTLANTVTLWVIASVPEGKINGISVGMPAKVRIGTRVVTGRVNYIDPRLNEDTRTGRVRVEIANSDNGIKVGSFVQVIFSPQGSVSGTFVPSEAVQTINDRSVVFVEKARGKFEARDVVIGNQISNLVSIKSGLGRNDRVIAKGSFLLKSRLLKDQLGEDE